MYAIYVDFADFRASGSYTRGSIGLLKEGFSLRWDKRPYKRKLSFLSMVARKGAVFSGFVFQLILEVQIESKDKGQRTMKVVVVHHDHNISEQQKQCNCNKQTRINTILRNKKVCYSGNCNDKVLLLLFFFVCFVIFFISVLFL